MTRDLSKFAPLMLAAGFVSLLCGAGMLYVMYEVWYQNGIQLTSQTRQIVFYALAGLGAVSAAVGFTFSYLATDWRRNTRTGLAWLSYAVCALAATIIFALLFILIRLQTTAS